MSFGFHPVPKQVIKKPNRKGKKVERVKGRVVPKPKERSQIDKKNYEKAMELYDHKCAECHNPYIEMHHIVFRSQMGRKSYRNLVPLCKIHHNMCHSNFEYAESWRKKHLEIYGEWFWSDKWDLFKAGLIQNTTDEAFERFMISEEKRCSGDSLGR